jgi:uncharacterized SAM-binding protein YcdF (DUF218 family)
MTDAAKFRAASAERSADRTPDRSTRRPIVSRPAKIITGIALVVVAAFVLGFLGFAREVVDSRPPADARADGIVALTGGTARIDGALQLLAEGRAARLLISGVNPSVTPDILARTLTSDGKGAIGCCVDLGHDARDTIGNAAETRAWATDRGYASLIVVTSDYHMARSMAELGTALPETRLIAYPVSNPELHLARWWSDPDAFGLLMREYVKYLWTRARLALAAPAAAGR